MSMQSVIQLNQQQLPGVLKAAHKVDQPLFIWGGAGVGKSQMVKQYADSIGGVLCDCRLGQFESVDLRGLPDVMDDQTVWRVVKTLPFVGTDWPDDVPILLFLDEAMQAAPTVQSVAFQLVLDRGISEHKLKKNVWIVAASNREADRAGTNKMLSPLANRFMHIQLVPTLDGFKDHAMRKGFHAVPMAYLNARPDHLDMFDEAVKASAKAFPTPRSWEVASKLFHKFEREPETLDLMVSATVGIGVGSELMQFSRMIYKLPTLEQIIADPDGVPVPVPNDERYAQVTMLSMSVDAENSAAVVQYVKRFEEQYQVLFMADLTRRDPTAVIGDEALLSYQTELHGAVYG